MEKTSDVELIGINDCVAVCQLSIETLRKYKTLGLITPCEKKGKKDLYNKKDVIFAKNFIKSSKNQGKSLQEIAGAFRASIEELDVAIKHINDEKTKNVLIIEDTKLLCEIIQKLLCKRFPVNKLAVYCAGDGLSGIKIAEKIQPDLIVLDVVLPLLSGIEVYEKLTKHPRLSHSKYIFISGGIEYNPKNEIFFSKPINLTEFVKSVENLTGLKATASQSPT
jgi:CheY-like chemotaxis protein